MVFHVGPWIYHVVVQGERTYVNSQERTIYLSKSMPRRERFSAVWHELVHAWLFYVPQPRLEEEHARLVSFIAEGMRIDMDRQGGTARLEKIDPIPPMRDIRLVIEDAA